MDKLLLTNRELDVIRKVLLDLMSKIQKQLLEIETNRKYYEKNGKNTNDQGQKLYCLGRAHSYEEDANRLQKILSENSDKK